MNLRIATVAGIALIVGASLLLEASLTAAADPRPNIVFILADDIGIDGFGCYGSDRNKNLTPNIDALARSGTRFDRCFASPLCGPSRCLLMTGRYPFRTGGLSNGAAARPSYNDEPSVAAILKQAGYVTGMAGKWRQMSDAPSDWGFDEYVTDPTASGYFWRNNYTKNGERISFDKDIYYPDAASDFAVDFLRQHRDEPFCFYLSEHLVHGPILRTPDSKDGADDAQLYDDNVAYLDKTVGKIVAELDKLGLREKTLILFSADNGTSKTSYHKDRDPKQLTGKIGGRSVHGAKGTLLEGGCRVPLVASWKGTMPAGRVVNDLIDFTDILPTFAELGGAKLSKNVTFDGHSFAPQLRGQPGTPREWVFVELGRHWFVRDDGWKLTDTGELFSMKDSPFVEAAIASESSDPDAIAARKRLQKVLDELNPAAGKTDVPDVEAKKKAKRAKKREAAKEA